MAGRFRHEDVSSVPKGWKVRTVKHGDHRVRVAFPPGRKQAGSGRLVSILHPNGENPCHLRSSNPAELMIMGANPPRNRKIDALVAMGHNPKEKLFNVEYRKDNEWWPLTSVYTETAKKAIRRAKERPGWKQLKLRAIEQKPENSSVSNPRVEVVHGTNPPVEEIVEEFTGTPAEWIDVYNEPHMQRGRYAQLGPLIALYIKPVGGGQVRRIGAPESRSADWESYWGGDAPVIVTDATARQLYFVGGAQDITEALEAFSPRDRGNGIVELGECRRIDYEGRKEHVADPDEDQWKHDHGEENGKLPTVLFDTNHKRLLYEGGDYRIEGPWIRN